MDTTLPTVPFGTTDMNITRVGLGAFAIGGANWNFGWGPQDDDASVATMVHAAELGINWIDTAPVYGHGHSELITAKALKALPENDRPYVFTKAGLEWDESDDMAPAMRVGRADRILKEIDDSLRRLEVERVDLLQMHWPSQDGHGIDEYWEAFASILASGKARAIGLSNHDVPMLEAAEAIQHVDSLQPPFNMLQREAGGDVIPWCAAHGTGVIVYAPMASGMLTGKYSREKAAALPDSDWRSRSDAFTTHLDRNLELVERLRPIAAKHDVTVGAIAIAWTLTFPGVSGAIVGGRSPEQVDGWAHAGSIALDDEDVAAITGALTELEAGNGPTSPVS